MSADQPLSERLRTAFERASDAQTTPDFRARLTQHLRDDLTVVPELPTTTSVARRPWVAIAAGVLFVVGLGAGTQWWLTSGRFSLLARLAAGDHQNCAIKFALDEKPIALAEAATRYDPAFGRLQQVSPVPGLPGGPISVLERHACVYRGRPFAHIVLAYKDQVVSVLVADGGAVGNEWWKGAAARELPPADGYQMASFRTPDHIVFVVSSLSIADVNAVAQSMIRPVSDALTGG